MVASPSSGKRKGTTVETGSTPAENARYNDNVKKAQEEIIQKKKKAIMELKLKIEQTRQQINRKSVQRAAAIAINADGIAANIQKDIDDLRKQVQNLTDDLKVAEKDLKKFENSIKSGKTNDSKEDKKPKNPAGLPNSTEGPASRFVYNAPMVKSAYVHPFGPQATSTPNDNIITDPGRYQNAAKLWQNNLGAKGTIQMTRDMVTFWQSTNQTIDKKLLDGVLYGFKFLYNPQTVTMGWGIVEEFSPEYVSMGADPAVPISTGIMRSTITCSILLNRIGDMAFINKDGSWKGPSQKYTLKKQGNVENYLPSQLSFNPYPQPVSQEERAMIYKRGTMYDLEYLFRVTQGPNPNFKSALNGTTADKGWLIPLPVELHLGDGLRYRVRLTSLDVSHTMFNERMVPILSTANLTFQRFYDPANPVPIKTYAGGRLTPDAKGRPVPPGAAGI